MTNPNAPIGTDRPIHFLPPDLSSSISSYNKAYPRHWELLNAITPQASEWKPFMVISIYPQASISNSSSEKNEIADIKYREIETGLEALERGELAEEGFEIGAIETAKQIVSQIKSREIAPPEVSWMGTEAIIMLWALGSKKLALTITDGEFGYTVRENKKTIKRQSNILPQNFDLLRLK